MVTIALGTVLLSQLLNMVYAVSQIGKHRSMITPGDAAGAVFIHLLYIALAVAALAKGEPAGWTLGVMWGVMGASVVAIASIISVVHKKQRPISKRKASVMVALYGTYAAILASAIITR